MSAITTAFRKAWGSGMDTEVKVRAWYKDAENQLSGDEHTGEVYPQLGLSVWIEGDCFRPGAIAMMARAGCTQADEPATADLVVFLGGEDVDPGLYGQKALSGTWFNPKRDSREAQIYQLARDNQIPMFGICRGMQFLHVMNGGELYQHVHAHGMPHRIKDALTGEVLMSSSMHHQMCMYPVNTSRQAGAVIPIAFAEPSRSPEYHFSSKVGGESTLCSDSVKELEAAYYPSIDSFAVQGHPELGDDEEYTAWCLRHLQAMIEELAEERVVELVDRLSPVLN